MVTKELIENNDQMVALNLKSCLNNHYWVSNYLKRVSWSDEVVADSNLQTTKDALPELTDSAILSMKSLQRYSRDQLLQLRQAPLSQKRPEFLDVAFNNANGIWDPELWHRSRSDTPNENGVRNEQPELHKRRSGDPRERIRKEQDGIILSPQRRSFNSGCYVPFKENQRANRPHSPLGKSENSHINHRELPPGARRIGSGRILSREVPWDFQEKSEIDNDYGYRKERSRDIDRDDRFERRTFTRDFDVNKEKHVGRNNGRYNDRRRISNENRDEEPEWFSGGPVSQNETIELRGFDDADDKIGKKKLSGSQKRKLKERLVKNSEAPQHPEIKEKQDENGAEKPNQNSQEGAAPNRKSPVPEKNNGGGDMQEKNKSAGEDVGSENNAFNIDDILKCDTIAELLSNGVGGEDGDNTGSRFSQWFKRESPIKQQLLDSRRSSLQDDHLFRSLLNDISEPNVSIPANSDLYFTPISPAANTANNLNMRQGNSSSIQKPINIFDMFQRNKQQNEGSFNSNKNHDISPSKLMSLEELEARMMHQGGGDPGAARAMAAQSKQISQKPEDDMLAFKRLLAHAVTTNNVHIQSKPQQSMSILEMLKHSQQDDATRLASQMMGPTSPNPMSSSQTASDLAFKLQQVQNQVHAQQHIQQNQIDMFSKLMNANAQRQQMGPSPLPEMGLTQSRELLSRPEAQAILRGLKRGDITPQHLYQQLAANPAMQPRHRELLLAILKLHGNGSAGMGPSPRVLSPVPPHPLFQQQQQQQQQLRVSPLPNAYCVSPILATSPNALTVPAMHQRIPSPRELQVHTQNIMQRALIKKKLEEQQENYKKRQEMQQRGSSPTRGLSPVKHTSSPTPLAFTPTSVLRKMTAEKDDVSKEISKMTDLQGKLPQGRPVMGIKSSLQAQAQQWNPQQLKQPGRPIVKANASLQTNQNQQQQQDQQQFYQQQQRLYSQQQQQQQQQHQSRKIGSQFTNHSQSGASSQQTSLSHHSYQQPLFSHTQQFQQLTHQLRAQHQQHQPPQQKPQFGNQQSLHWSQQHQVLMGHNYDARGVGERGGASNNGGDLSPTSNQLARWFSPELLERARAGKVPHMPSATAAQHAISLEEIERQTAPPVHN